MDGPSTTILETLDLRVDDILSACTKCGKCAAVCPTPGIAGIDTSGPEALTAGILDILRSGDGDAAARRWASACCGSGFCLNVCEYGINPRFMLVMARRALLAGQPEAERRDAGKAAFKEMSRGVRVISRLQLPAELLERLSPSSHSAGAGSPDLIFYTGCNMLKTPHIGLLCLDVLDRLDVSYEVYGGPANCCGILQLRTGDTGNAGRQAETTVERFRKSKASEVLSWCPTCQIQFGETLSADGADGGFDMTMFPIYLARRLNDLRPVMTQPVHKRVALHEYPGSQGVTEAVVRLLKSIPGLEFVDLEMPRAGYVMSSLDTLPEFRRELLAGTFRAAEAAGVTTLAGVYHGDHRELCGHEAEWPFEIVNYMDLIGESMGIHRPDLFKRLKLMDDVDAIIAASGELIDAHGLDLEEVREVVLKNILGERHLPVDRALHDGAGE